MHTNFHGPLIVDTSICVSQHNLSQFIIGLEDLCTGFCFAIYFHVNHIFTGTKS